MAEGSADIARLLRDEALACFAAAGIDVAGWDEVKSRRANGLRYVAIEGNPRHGGSSWQSVVRGAGDIETDYLNGEIVLLGRLHGVPTPAHGVMQWLGNELARRKLPPGSFEIAAVGAMIDAQQNH
jgi:2-dehydropantoate 2-reductase